MPNEEEPDPNQQNSDDNIYDDFMEFNFSDKKDKYEDSEKVNKLLEKVDELTKENEELKKTNENLNKNISSLLKTARNEIQRKDSVINELRTQVDSVVFKRHSKMTKDKFTETENWNYVCKCREKKERSKSKESRISETRNRLKNKEKKNSIERRDENYLICDNRSDYYKEKRSKSPEKYRGSWPYKLRDRSYEKSRKSFRYNYKDHLKYDSLDKRRRSDNSRSCSRKRSPREKEFDRRESRDKRKRTRSHSKERSQSLHTKDSSSNKHKDRFSAESVSKSQKKIKPASGNSKTEENLVKNENTKKEEKKSNNFEGKSPLDAEYDETLGSWDSDRQFTTDSKKTAPEIEEGEYVNNNLDDWMLSFKNERQNTVKPLTLYSRRMMKKFSEEKSKERKEDEETGAGKEIEVKKIVEEKRKNEIPKSVELEKEPGELTDDENVVESSKEFQELTKVASIENKFDRTLEANETFENDVFDESVGSGKTIKNTRKENQVQLGVKPAEDESKTQKENENSGGELVEFSPFKNNYKLIEISPKKQKTKDHILDLYKINPQASKTVVPPFNPVPSSNKPGEKKTTNSKEEKQQTKEVTQSCDNFLKVEQKIVGKQANLTEIESKEKTSLPVDKKNISHEEKISKKGNVQEKNSSEDKKKQNIECVDNSLGRGKRRGTVKKDISETGEKNSKKRRGEREFEEEGEIKKQKVSESCGRRTRSTKEKEKESKPEVSTEKMKEDISSFEFFKPIISKTEALGEQEEPVSTTCSGAFKMSATMSFTSVFCLETPIKSVEKLENLTINEQVMYQLNLNEKNGSFSPLITPRRMLKNDLMLTDSEDDSFVKVDSKEKQNKNETNEEFQEENEMEEEKEYSNSENSEYDSDSGASDFVDLL